MQTEDRRLTGLPLSWGSGRSSITATITMEIPPFGGMTALIQGLYCGASHLAKSVLELRAASFFYKFMYRTPHTSLTSLVIL
jgi:hypothetical protein